MKVCVFSSPRTRSTMVNILLEKYLQLTNYGEIFAYDKTDFDFEGDRNRLMALVNDENYVVKITPTTFNFKTFLEPSIFPWLTFDKMILLNRTNILRQISSWIVLTHTQKVKTTTNIDNTDIQNILQDVDSVKFDMHQVKYIIKSVNDFYKTSKFIQDQGIHTLSLTYEEFDTNKKLYVSKLNEFLGTNFTEQQADSVTVNFTGLDYDKFINHIQLSSVCKRIIEEDNLSYLKEQINLGNIIC